MNPQLVNYNGQLINLNGGVLANKFPIRDGLMLYVDSRIDASYPRTGTTVNDLSVSALSGTLVNGVEHTPNKYFSIDGVDDLIQIPVSGDATKTYTVNFLARVTGGRSSTNAQLYGRTSFFSFSNSNISDRRGYRTFALQTWNASDESIFYFRGNGTSYINSGAGYHLRDINGGFGDFHLYSVVYDPDTTKIYINGELFLEEAYTVGNNGFDKLWIGTRYWSGSFVDQPMSGDFAFFQMYERELSQSEIQSIYSNVKQDYGKIIEDGLVLNLDADNYSSHFGSGGYWLDVSPSGNDGTLLNGPTFQSDPAAVVFDGVNDYGTVYDTSTVFQDNDPWTAIVAYRINDTGITGSNGLITSQKYISEQDPGGWGIICQIFSDNGNRFQIHLTYDNGVDTPTHQTVYNSVTNVPHQEWNILAFSYNPDTSSIKGYRNGVLQTTTAATQGWTVNKTSRFAQLHMATQGGWNGIDYSASFGEVQIYKRTLSDDEIEYNFNARRGRYGI